jgi:hypothetical protein
MVKTSECTLEPCDTETLDEQRRLAIIKVRNYRTSIARFFLSLVVGILSNEHNGLFFIASTFAVE